VFYFSENRFFGNVEDCKFFFECDCCFSKILFTTPTQFVEIFTCGSDIISESKLTIESEFEDLEKLGVLQSIKKYW